MARPAWGCGCLLVAMLAGCTALDPLRVQAFEQARSTAPWSHARVHELTQVPFFAQTDWHCGPAALATVLVDAGFGQVSPARLVDEVFLPLRSGSLQLEMLVAARRSGAIATRIPGQLGAIAQEVDAGHPVLVLLNLGLDWAPQWHYAVVVGYDLDAREWLLRSGTTRVDRIGFNPFERTWARGEHWAVVVRQPGLWPVSAEPSEAERSASAFADGGSPAQALKVWRSLSARWPGRELGWLGLGVSLLQDQQPLAAADAFRRGLQLRPGVAGFNNLAVALSRAGDRAGAKQALAQAQQLIDTGDAEAKRWQAAVQATREALQRGEAR